jgi:hypothetical protein
VAFVGLPYSGDSDREESDAKRRFRLLGRSSEEVHDSALQARIFHKPFRYCGQNWAVLSRIERDERGEGLR